MGLITSMCEGEPFAGRIDAGDLGPVRICRIAAAPHKPGQASRAASSALAPFYKVVFQIKGTTQISQRERRTELTASKWSIYDVSQPYSMRNLDALDQVAILVPKASCSNALAAKLRNLPRQPFALRGVSRILFDYACSILEQFDAVDATSGGNALGDTMIELTRLALLESLDAGSEVLARERVRQRVEAHIMHNLFDGRVSIASVARSMNYTTRYLHKVFSGSGHTIDRFIWERRLEQCRRALADPRQDSQSITEIAFAWGFNSASHFGRTFKQKYGMTPNAFRKGHQRIGT